MLTETPAWKALEAHYAAVRDRHLRDLFAEDPARGERFAVEAEGLYLDYSKNRITDATIGLLIQLAEQCNLRGKRDAMFRGDHINVTEDRAVKHWDLRSGTNPEVEEVLRRMSEFASRIRSENKIRNIVNIGIGGSDLGPVMAYEALRFYSDRRLTLRFVSNVDGTDFCEATRDLNPAETLFIVASKTFTTLETMANAQAAKEWIQRAGLPISEHFVALSTARDLVEKFGIDPKNMFGFWDWVGGRYSMDSAIGLSTMIAIGPENFRAMLDGFRAIDEHFKSAPFEKNLPVLMGLLTVWYNNFFDAQTVAVLPYDQYLKRFPAYLQQLTMESCGKSVTIGGKRINYQTGPVYWGEPGTNGQHSFYQLLHQGTKLIHCDFIGFRQSLNPLVHDGMNHHDLLMANVFAQSKALAFGQSAPPGQPYREFDGNRPSNTILAEKLTPRVLGLLVALYEHNVFTQAAIWDINAFDQFGVELGKVLAKEIAPVLQDKVEPTGDSSSVALIKRYRGQ
jgi:glucose-6-phosphate isomerase